MADKKDKIRLDGPMSYDHWSPITPEQAAEAKRRAKEFSAEVKKELDEEFGGRNE